MTKTVLIFLALFTFSLAENLKFLENDIELNMPSTVSLKTTNPLGSLDSILKPKSVAVIGASSKKFAIGYELVARLLELKFTGKIYPINPKAKEILGLKVYKSILDIPDQVDLAVIAVKASLVLDAIDMCNQKGVKGLVMITAGFKEVDHEGALVEQEMLRRVRQYGMRLVGPNCIGVMNTHPSISLDASFALKLPIRGNIGFVSQSGALVAGILNILPDLHVGFAQLISVGNQPDVNAETAIEYWENDADVGQILLYIEGITDAKNFRKLATRISKKKPMIALKSGRSSAGASAASSHTGSLAGTDKAADTLLSKLYFNFFRTKWSHQRNQFKRFLHHSQSILHIETTKGKQSCCHHQRRRPRYYGY